MIKNLRNIAIIAHIDHGKTTLVDQLLKQSGAFNNRINTTKRIMDSNELEKEKGITIIAKNTAIVWNNHRINIIDTPGHADFGGEVERIMSMVDSVLLLVDAKEGPMPQTRFVTQKSFSYGLKPIVVINKVDHIGVRIDWVLNKVFDLFVNLNASEEQLDFPVVYTSALNGTSGLEYKNMTNNMIPLLDSIIKNVKEPSGNINEPLQMRVSQIIYNSYIGIIGIGRIDHGSIKTNQIVTIIDKKGKHRNSKVGQILQYMGLQQVETNTAEAGDIIAITGLGKLNISDTICDPLQIKPLPPLLIDEPTMCMLFSVNTSPFCGKEGKYITFRQILKRLKKEQLNNISLRVEEITENNDSFLISGRGELHLSILIENMRREGFEIAVSRPKVIFKTINGVKKEPFDIVVLSIEEKYQGEIMKIMSNRKGEIKDIILKGKNRIQLEYLIPSRGLIGLRANFLSITSGTGILHSSFSHYDNLYEGEIGKRKNGVLISNGYGRTTAYALYNLQNRGKLLLNHGTEVYEGQIIGIHNRSNDLTVNCLTNKKLTNMRASGNDEALTLVTVTKMSLDLALEFINEDELVEITPQSIRLRKRYLTESERKRANRLIISL